MDNEQAVKKIDLEIKQLMVRLTELKLKHGGSWQASREIEYVTIIYKLRDLNTERLVLAGVEPVITIPALEDNSEPVFKIE